MANRRFQGTDNTVDLEDIFDDDCIQVRHNNAVDNGTDKALKFDTLKANPIAICTSSASTVAKVATVSNMQGFTLVSGRIITVYFENENTATSPTLNINGTGAIPIILENQASGVSIGSGCWSAGVYLQLQYIDFTLNGVQQQKFVIIGHDIAEQTSDYTKYADGTIEYRSKYENPSDGIYAGRLNNNQFYIDISMSRTVVNQEIFEVLTLPVNVRPSRNFFLRASGWQGTGSAWIEKTEVLFYVQTNGKISGCANFNGPLDICGSAIISD